MESRSRRPGIRRFDPRRNGGADLARNRGRGRRASQTINFPSLASKTFGAAPVNVSATASSALPVTLQVTAGPCTFSVAPPPPVISPALLSINGTGSCTVQATQTGNGSFNAATPVSRTFTISKANQTITVTGVPSSLLYGAPNVPVTATSTSLLPVTVAVTSGACEVVIVPSNPSVKINGAGSCWVRASQAGDSNYNAAFPVTKVVSVTRAPLTVTADSPPDKVYGAPLPPIGGTITGFVNGDTPASLSGTLSCIGFAIANSPVGTYPTSCSGVSSPNYNISYVNGSLKIVKAPQSISIDAIADKTYGALSSTVTTHSSSNLLVTLSSDTPGVCSVSATWFGPVTVLHAGSCTLRAKQAGNSNYAAASPDATQTFTVNPAPLSITADNKTILSAAPLPAFTLTYAGFVNFDTALSAVVTTPITCNAYTQANPTSGSDDAARPPRWLWAVTPFAAPATLPTTPRRSTTARSR